MEARLCQGWRSLISAPFFLWFSPFLLVFLLVGSIFPSLPPSLPGLPGRDVSPVFLSSFHGVCSVVIIIISVVMITLIHISKIMYPMH